jgi:hypothetical protein
MDTTQNYEDSLRQLENLKYFLRMMNFQDEANLVEEATKKTKEAFELSKVRPPQYLK